LSGDIHKRNVTTKGGHAEMKKKPSKYRYRVSRALVYAEPVKHTDNLDVARQAADRLASETGRSYRVWDQVENKVVYVAKGVKNHEGK
jgi:hypothetical protein